MKKLFIILGVCYVTMALIMAQSQSILSGSCNKAQEQREGELGGNNQRSGGTYSQSFGLTGGATYELYTNTKSAAGRQGTVSNLVTRSRIPDFVDNCLIVWSADYCAPCRALKPTIQQLQNEGYVVYILDYPSNRNLGKQWGVTSVPTSIVLTSGKEVKRFIGVVTLEQIKEHLKYEQSIDYTIW